jgi:hypothetical protein
MVKIDSVNGQKAPLSEKTKTVSGDVRDLRQSAAGSDDSLRISEEGKKKHIFGRLMIRISEEGKAKGPVDR